MSYYRLLVITGTNCPHDSNIQTPTLPTSTLLTFKCTQVIWFLVCPTSPRVSFCATNRLKCIWLHQSNIHTPPSPHPRSSLSHVLRSFGFLCVRPGLVSPSVRPINYSVCVSISSSFSSLSFIYAPKFSKQKHSVTRTWIITSKKKNFTIQVLVCRNK
jgi:hypothetical protein